MNAIIRFLLRLCFGFRAFNTAALEAPGPVLLLPNHVSWFDWLFLSCCLDTRWRFVTSIQSSRVSFVHRLIMINRFTFPVDTDSPYAVKHMAQFLEAGGKLVLFPEGRLSRTGSLMKLYDGTGFLLFKTHAKVVTCYLRGAHRLPFSPNPNHKKLFPRVTAHFSDLLTPPPLQETSTARARHKLTLWLYDAMVRQRFDVELNDTPKNVLAAIIQAASQFPSVIALEDAMHTKLTYRRLLAGTVAMADRWRKQWPEGGEARVGVMLPTALAMPVTLLSLWAVEKTPAILNYSTGISTVLACAQLAGLKHIITSKLFLEKARLNVQPMKDAGIEFIYLEEVHARISRWRQLQSLLWVSVLPGAVVPAPASDVAVVLFTSGSEGTPKGVELTHTNLLSNVRQLLALLDVTEADRLFNALPLFHSFGLIGILAPLIYGCYVFLYPSPLHYRVIPTAIYDLDCTIFFSTNTFLNGYARKANSFDFRALRLLIGAGEKLQETTANAWARQFGVRILEAYGATECSACITINTPINPRFGSVGKLMPGMDCKFEPVEGIPNGGRLWVRGPNVMRGYLNQEDNDRFLAAGGWYDTGDIASLDQDGFLQIVGRLKRFAKVSGEMISLTAVEEALAGAFPQYGLRFRVAVMACPDADRGESLFAVTNDQRLNMEELRAAIKAKGLSNLSTPREIKYQREIPKLGTGKVDYFLLQKLIG